LNYCLKITKAFNNSNTNINIKLNVFSKMLGQRQSHTEDQGFDTDLAGQVSSDVNKPLVK
jgi:hypothetical protein